MQNPNKGTVKFFNIKKGYGFIKPEEGGDDVFVHIRAVNESNYDSLSEGDIVEFEKKEGRNGKFQAEKLRIVN